MYFRYERLRKTWLDICLKSLSLEERLTANVINRPKQSCNMNDSTVTTFTYQFKVNESEHVSFGDLQNLITVC